MHRDILHLAVLTKLFFPTVVGPELVIMHHGPKAPHLQNNYIYLRIILFRNHNKIVLHKHGTINEKNSSSLVKNQLSSIILATFVGSSKLWKLDLATLCSFSGVPIFTLIGLSKLDSKIMRKIRHLDLYFACITVARNLEFLTVMMGLLDLVP